MVEKFSDFESAGFLNKEGKFVFEVVSAELKMSNAGNEMVVLECKSDEGQTTLYHSLSTKARWSYNNLIKACLNLDTKEKIEAFECDYQLIHNDLIGKKFMGTVECQTYEKTVKKPLDDGTFEEAVETKESFKVVQYDFVK